MTAPLVFPATDRPSASFLTRFERNLHQARTRDTEHFFAFSHATPRKVDQCCAQLGDDARLSAVSIGKRRGFVGFPRTTATSLVEIAYGGDASDAGRSGRAFPATAQRLSDRLAGILATAVTPRLAPNLVELSGACGRIEDIVRADADVLSLEFALEWGGVHVGPVMLCVPIESLADVENSVPVVSEVAGWRDRIERVLYTVRVPVRCVLGRPTLSAGQVARLAPGTVIPIAALSEVALIAAGYRVAKGSAEIRDGQAVVVIKSTEIAQ